MQCYENLALRLKVYTDIKAIRADVVFDELVLSDLIQDYSVETMAELIALDNQTYRNLLNDAASQLAPPIQFAA